jgi:hypothetical protein
MKVRVLKSAGQTGFRTIGSVFEVNTMSAKILIREGLVEDADAPVAKPKPKPKRKTAAKKKA